MQVEQGLAHPESLDLALQVRDAGGFTQWTRAFEARSSEDLMSDLSRLDELNAATKGKEAAKQVAIVHELHTMKAGSEPAEVISETSP